MCVGFDTRVRPSPFQLPIVVRTSSGIPKVRQYLKLAGFAAPTVVGVHNNSLCNLQRGLIERVYCVEKDGVLQPPPQALAGVFAERLGGFRTALFRHLRPCTPYTSEELCGTYTGSKKVMMERACESLANKPVSRDDAKLKTFVKSEKLPLWKKPDPAPRVIQPRDARYNAALGPYVKKLEHPLYAAIAECFGEKMTVMKGVNCRQQAQCAREKWDSFVRPAGVGLDASRFDQHVGKQALQWEHSVYVSAFPLHKQKLRELLSWQIGNCGEAYLPEGRIKYYVEGNRMSGDMNTSLGNCLLMCAMVYAYAAYCGVRIKLMNNGDDCMVIMESGDVATFVVGLDQWFLDMGFTMKVEEPVFMFEQLEFCQTKPVYDGSEWIMTRSPFSGLAKDVVCLRPQTLRGLSDEYARWARSVGTCGLAASSGIPVMQAAYNAMRRFGGVGDLIEGDGYSGLSWMSKGLVAQARPVTAEARASFYWAWGLYPEEQIILERHFDTFVFAGDVTSYDSSFDHVGPELLLS